MYKMAPFSTLYSYFIVAFRLSLLLTFDEEKYSLNVEQVHLKVVHIVNHPFLFIPSF